MQCAGRMYSFLKLKLLV